MAPAVNFAALVARLVFVVGPVLLALLGTLPCPVAGVCVRARVHASGWDPINQHLIYTRMRWPWLIRTECKARLFFGRAYDKSVTGVRPGLEVRS